MKLKIQFEMKLKIQFEMKLKIQFEMKLKIQFEMKFKIQFAIQFKIQFAIKFKIQFETKLVIKFQCNPEGPYLWPLVHAGGQRVSQHLGAGPLHAAAHKGLVDGLLHEDPGAGHAALALVEEQPAVGLLQSLLHWGTQTTALTLRSTSNSGRKCASFEYSQSQSAKTIMGFLPPSSRVTLFRLLSPAALWISFPTWEATKIVSKDADMYQTRPA